MGIFDKLRKSKRNASSLTQLKQENYEQKYINECKFIWKNYVPKSGHSDFLQGELLRELEKLRCEAQDNGNINWDSDFTYFCVFIKDTLCSKDIYTNEEKDKIVLIMDYFKSCGEYAEQWNEGLISEKDVDMDSIAYTKDNLYDVVSDAIGYLHFKAAAPIPYEINQTIKR